jgi:CelD/BcsL family acetyltransferase involved in cellulose biosynthesis
VENGLKTPRAVWRTTNRLDEFDRDWTTFIDLHQRRRQSVGDVGCFSHPKFAAFHEEVARKYLERGRLRLQHLEFDGRPIAAEYGFAGGQNLYAYQSGIEPAALDHEPGRMAAAAVIRQAIAEGVKHYDLLRGDEPYKAHWRGKPFPTQNVSFAAPHRSAQWRFSLRRHARRIRSAFRWNAGMRESTLESEFDEPQPVTSA